MSARNGDKSRFHRLRKAKIRRRLRTELLQSLVTTAPEHAAATEAPVKPPKPPKAKSPEVVAPKAEAPNAGKPTAEKSKPPRAEKPRVDGPAEDQHPRGPLAAVAETLGSTIGTLVAKTTHPHQEPEHSDKPAE